jgi:hypothetical protein
VDEQFGPDDQAEFEAARDRLIVEFADSGGAGFEGVAAQLLDFKWGYLDGDLTSWSPAHIDEVLFDLYPAKVLIDDEATSLVPDGVAAFLRFLSGRRSGHSPPLDVLAEYVEQSASRFAAAMNDQDNWSFGKRMWATALAEGVDLTDERAIGRWMDDFNARSLAERDHILGPSASPSADFLGAVFGPFPPVVLAPQSELTALAASSPLVSRVLALVHYVGSGRAVTDRGNLKLADGKELVSVLGTDDAFDQQIGERTFKTTSSESLPDVDWTYRMALETRMLVIDGRRVRPGANAGWVDAPLDVVYGALLVLLKRLGPTQHRYRTDHYGFGWYAETLDAQLLPILLELYRTRAPRPIEELVETMWAVLLDEYDLSDVPPDKLAFHRRLVDSALRGAFDRLAELGVVELTGEVITPREHFGVDRSGGALDLTPLGLWAMQRLASSLSDAPIVGALREHPAPELLRAAADLADDVARGEVDAWVEHHGDRAAGELCAALADADETGRGVAFRALLRIGAPAATAVETLQDHGDLDDFVTVFRVDTLAAAPDEMDRAGNPQGWVRLLHTVLQLWGPDATAAAWAAPAAGEPGIDAMLGAAWRVPGPATAEVLGAVGGHHPDKLVAKAARKALFKHRSAT